MNILSGDEEEELRWDIFLATSKSGSVGRFWYKPPMYSDSRKCRTSLLLDQNACIFTGEDRCENPYTSTSSSLSRSTSTSIMLLLVVYLYSFTARLLMSSVCHVARLVLQCHTSTFDTMGKKKLYNYHYQAGRPKMGHALQRYTEWGYNPATLRIKKKCTRQLGEYRVVHSGCHILLR